MTTPSPQRPASPKGDTPLPAPSPPQAPQKPWRFFTERPTFATDDLLAELTSGGATVRATPLVAQRGFLTNLMILFAPMLLFVPPLRSQLSSGGNRGSVPDKRKNRMHR